MPYESGMDPIHDARRRFDVRFHLVAIAFLVFDVELLFLYPWAVASRRMSRTLAATVRPVSRSVGIDSVVGKLVESRGLVFGEVMVFIALLGAGLCVCLAERGVSMAIDMPDNVMVSQLDALANWCAQEQPLADAVRHGLLRHRADGHRRQQARHRPLRRRGHSASARGSAT